MTDYDFSDQMTIFDLLNQDGKRYGWGRVLDYISIPWRDPEHWYLNPNGEEHPNQMTIYDYL